MGMPTLKQMRADMNTEMLVINRIRATLDSRRIPLQGTTAEACIATGSDSEVCEARAVVTERYERCVYDLLRLLDGMDYLNACISAKWNRD